MFFVRNRVPQSMDHNHLLGELLRLCFLIALTLSFIACRLIDNSIKGGVGDGGKNLTPKISGLKLDCSTTPYENFPYSCPSTIESSSFNSGAANYSIVDSSCKGLIVNNTGQVTGRLSLKQTESCSYRLRAFDGVNTLNSELVSLTASSSLVASYSSESVTLQKSGGMKSVTLQLSKPSPYSVDVSYKIYGTGSLDALSGYSASGGTVTIPKGSSSINLDFEVPGSSSLVNIDYLNFQLDALGVTSPTLYIGMHTNPLIPFDSISTGSFQSYSTCGISSGALYCWGLDFDGQVGNGSGSSADVTVPVKIGSSTSWTQVSTSRYHTCGIDGGALYCWGADLSGQLGNGSGSSADVTAPVQIGSSTSWTQVTTGSSFTCGINGGALYCWGYDSVGQVGNGSGSSANVTAPMQIGSSTSWTQVSAGNDHSCGVDGGALYCWGADTDGQVGNGSGSSADVTAPVQIGSSTSWTQVSAGNDHSCGVDGGALYCWGADTDGQVGNGSGSSADVTAPVQIGSSTSWIQVSGGQNQTCGINGGELYCWGDNTHGQLGLRLGFSTNVVSPTLVGASTAWTQIVAGYLYSCGINNGAPYCWGRNFNGRMGNGLGSSQDVTSPNPVGVANSWTKIVAGHSHSCALDGSSLYCWGHNFHGAVGNGSSSVIHVTSPTSIKLSTSWSQISAAGQNTCGINNDSKLYCWGNNSYGQLGNGSSSSTAVVVPEQIGVSTSWTHITSGSTHNCGIDNERLYCWGRDAYGEIGNGPGSSTNVMVPEQIGASTSWTQISAGTYHSCGIDNGALYCWGRDLEAQVGNGSGSSANVTAPEQIGVSTSWTQVSAGRYHSCGIDNGALYCWGNDSDGQLGNGSGSSANVTTPAQIGVSSSWTQIATGAYHTCGIDNGALYCWGKDSDGQLGNGPGSSSDITSPSQVGVSTNWSQVSTGFGHTCGIDGGKLLCWGSDYRGAVASTFHALDQPTLIMGY